MSPTVHEVRNAIRSATGRFEREFEASFTKEELQAICEALEESPAPELTRTAVTSAAWRVASADRELARYEGEFPVSRLDSTIADYVIATAIGRAAPDVSRTTVETLASA